MKTHHKASTSLKTETASAGATVTMRAPGPPQDSGRRAGRSSIPCRCSARGQRDLHRPPRTGGRAPVQTNRRPSPRRRWLSIRHRQIDETAEYPAPQDELTLRMPPPPASAGPGPAQTSSFAAAAFCGTGHRNRARTSDGILRQTFANMPCAVTPWPGQVCGERGRTAVANPRDRAVPPALPARLAGLNPAGSRGWTATAPLLPGSCPRGSLRTARRTCSVRPCRAACTE